MVRDETLKICLWNRRKKVNDDFVVLCSASAFHLLNAGGLGNCHAEVVSEATWLLDVTGDRGDETSFVIQMASSWKRCQFNARPHSETNKHPQSKEVSLMRVSLDCERKLTLARHSNTVQT